METIDTSPGPAPEVIVIGADHPGVQVILDMLQMMELLGAHPADRPHPPGDVIVSMGKGDMVFIDEMDDGVEALFSGEYKMPMMPTRDVVHLKTTSGFRNEPTYGKAARNAIHRRKKR